MRHGETGTGIVEWASTLAVSLPSTPPVVGRPDERENLTYAFLVPVDDVLIAHRQVFERHLTPVMLNQTHDHHIVARDAGEIVSAVEAVCQMMGEDREDDIERVADEMDDRRLREDQSNQAKMRLIEGILSVNQRPPLRSAPSWRAR